MSNSDEFIDNEEKPSFLSKISLDSLRSPKRHLTSTSDEIDDVQYHTKNVSYNSNVSKLIIGNINSPPKYFVTSKCTYPSKCVHEIFVEHECKQPFTSDDSGLIQSTDHVNIKMKKNKYDHVQSKVKKYINDIKNQQSQRHKELLENRRKEQVKDDELYDSKESDEEKLLLKQEIEEKDIMIQHLLDEVMELQENYAAAEKKIEDLRFKVHEVQRLRTITPRSSKKTSKIVAYFSPKEKLQFETLMSNKNEVSSTPVYQYKTNFISVPSVESKWPVRLEDKFSKCIESSSKLITSMVVDPCECWDMKYDFSDKDKSISDHEENTSVQVPPLEIKDESSSFMTTHSFDVSWEDTSEIVNISQATNSKSTSKKIIENFHNLENDKNPECANINLESLRTSSTSYKTLLPMIFRKNKNKKSKSSSQFNNQEFVRNNEFCKNGKHARTALFKFLSRQSNSHAHNSCAVDKEVTIVNPTVNPSVYNLETSLVQENKDINLDTAIIYAEEMKKMSETLKTFLVMNLK